MKATLTDLDVINLLVYLYTDYPYNSIYCIPARYKRFRRYIGNVSPPVMPMKETA